MAMRRRNIAGKMQKSDVTFPFFHLNGLKKYGYPNWDNRIF